jgi:hypothetical protein
MGLKVVFYEEKGEKGNRKKEKEKGIEKKENVFIYV